MLLIAKGTDQASGNPSALVNILPGGTTGVQTTGSTAVPFLTGPTLESVVREVYDQSINLAGVQTPATAGQLLVQQFAAANTGGVNYASLVNQPAVTFLDPNTFGIVEKVAPSDGNTTTLICDGMVNALVQTSNGKAVAPGTYLTYDQMGNLQPFNAPATSPPTTITNVGTTGSTSYSYGLVALSINGVNASLSCISTTTAGNATLTTASYNNLTWTPVDDTATYLVVRQASSGTPSTAGVIGQVNAGVASFDDKGLAILPNTSATQYFQLPNAVATPTVTPGGTTGSTTYGYKVTAVMPNGVMSAAESTEGTTSTGNATLTATNNNKVTWTNTLGAVKYLIDRTTAGGTSPTTTGFIGYATDGVAGFTDTGIAATTFPSLTKTPNQTPAPGQLVAISMGTLAASTTTPTSTLVRVVGKV